jgi:glycosyltransferase involved in cell wall biosynthesis
VKSKGKIVIHSLVFHPDGVSTAYLYNDIAFGLKQSGYDVFVLTTTPHYNILEKAENVQELNKGLLGLYYTSNYLGINVVHIPMYKFKSTLLRLVSFIYWHFISFWILLFSSRIKLILSPSPPLTIGLISGLIAKVKGASFIYNVQEIYPDLLIHSGKLKNKIAIQSLKYLEKIVYNLATAVTTIDQEFYQTIEGRFKDNSKLKIIPNFVDLSLFNPSYISYEIPKEFIDGFHDKKIAFYAGNIGNYQDWEPILYAAKNTTVQNLEFWIIGEGVKKQYLIEQIEKQNLKNIKVFPYQKREVIAALNNQVALHFISINEQIENEGFPSKIYSMLSSAKPTIVVAGFNTPIYKFLENKDCALLVSKNRSVEFTNAIDLIINDKALASKLGQNAYDLILNQYSKEKVVDNYIKLTDTLLMN